MWPIVREALRDASPDIRGQARVIFVFWLCMVALQV
jgi:hypothetical protein